MAPSRTRCALTVAGVAALLLVACGGSSNPPSPGNPGGGGGETITGRERIGWTQQAIDAEQLATFKYAAYVDGVRRVLDGAACPGAASPFDCSAQLPPMGAGQHTIELVSFTELEDTILESERSAPLRVTVSALTSSAVIADTTATLTSAGGHRFQATVIARDLDDPTDLAVSPEGRVFVTERSGRVQIVERDGRSHLALELDDAALSPDSGLTSIALDPKFDSNGYVYLAYGSDSRVSSATKIARFRERNGVLAQGALVFRERTDTPPLVTLRFGGDGKLYAGVGAGSDPRDAQNLSSPSGKILRLNADGTSPRDNPRASVTFTSGHREPRGLAWQSPSSTMWEIERDQERGDELNMIVAGRDYGWPEVLSANRSVGPTLRLPIDTDVAGAAFVTESSRSPLAGELLIASLGAQDVLRIRITADGEPTIVDGMTQRRYGRISAVAVSADGSIYVATSNRELSGPRADVVVQIVPVTW